MSEYTREHPKRTPPPLGKIRVGRDGVRYPVMESPAVECGARVHLRGIGWVECVRLHGHTVALNFAHSNGLGDEWCFDEPTDPPTPEAKETP